MASRWSDSQDEKETLNAVGTSPDWRVRYSPQLEVHQRDGASSSFDFVLTYSIRHKVDPFAKRFQNKDASSVPNADDDDPFTTAAKAHWLSTHRTHVRCLSVGHSRARHTMRMAARSSKMKIGDSPGMLLTMSMNQLGRWGETAVSVLPV